MMIGPVLSGLLCLYACRSTPAQVCYSRESWTCVAELATQDLARDPDCNRCKHDAAEAEMQLALSNRSTDAEEIALRLIHAASALAMARQREPHNDVYKDDADDARHIVKQMLDDALPNAWKNIREIPNADDRVSAVVRHHQFYGGLCHHPVVEEWDAYVASFESLPSAMYERLRRFENAPFAPRLLNSYLRERSRLVSGTQELEMLQQIRAALADTSYASAVVVKYEERFDAIVKSTRNPDDADALCTHAYGKDAEERCWSASRSLWRSRLARLTDLHKKKEVCEKLRIEEEQDDCRTEVARDAVERLGDTSSREDLRFALSLCGDDDCRYAVRRKAFERAAREAREHQEAYGIEAAPEAASRSVDAWNAYIDRFDSIAKGLRAGATFRSLAPDDYARAVMYREAAHREAKRRFQDIVPTCNAALSETTDSQHRLADAQTCLSVLSGVVQLDQKLEPAVDVLQEVALAHAALTNIRAPSASDPWRRVAFALVLPAVLRLIIGDGSGAYYIRVLNPWLYRY